MEAHPVAKIETARGKWAEKWGDGKFVIPTPKEIEELIRAVPKGKLITVNRMREMLAKRYDVDYACPITTGIFTWVVSNAAEEARSEGAKRIAPWWRVVKDDGGLNPKAPGGETYQAKLLRQEGYHIVRKSLRSRRPVVENAAALFV